MKTFLHKSGAEQNPIEGWEAGTRELDARIVAAVANKDVDGVMSCFLDSPELAVVMWGTELHGPAQVRDALTRFFNKYERVELKIDRESEVPSGNEVIAVGQATYRITEAGVEKKINELWTEVRRKMDGKWVVVLDHSEILKGRPA